LRPHNYLILHYFTLLTVELGFDKGKVHGPGQIVEKMGASPEQLIIDEVAEEGTIGAAGLAHGASREKYYFPDITIS
jgi:hypothetical protein